jgi:hypothetical protein
MKKIQTLLLFLLGTVSILAQAPEKTSYQAVLRDASNTLLSNQEVGMQISILQSTAAGTAVYLETQTTTTNINGLVSIEIGSGTSSDDFSAIDWSAGPYFIKTETDPTGGSSYTISGTSQFMSVPYAFYAKNSGSSIAGPQGDKGDKGDTGAAGTDGANGGEKGDTGAQGPAGSDGADGAKGETGAQGDTGAKGDAGGETGPKGDPGETGPQGPSGGATGEQGPAGPPGTDGSNGPPGNNGSNGSDGSNGAQGNQGADGADGTGGVTVGGLGILVEGAGTSGDNYTVSTKVYTIGFSPELGGYVFRLSDDGRHGLVASTEDQSTSSNWFNAQDLISDPTNHDENGQKFSNWRLPTKHELNEIIEGINLNALTLSAENYWSSTELNSGSAFFQNVLTTSQLPGDKDNTTCYLRAVRSF